MEPKRTTSSFRLAVPVILVLVLLSLHNYQKGGRQDSYQL